MPTEKIVPGDRGRTDEEGAVFDRTRRNFCWSPLIAATTARAQEETSVVPSDRAIARLIQGNGRYAQNKQQHPDESLELRNELEQSQHPFAVVLSCSDSRVPPELIFDQGLGDLFVIRVAGNIAADDELGSIEYAVEHLHTKLVVVLGQEKCGAITAAVHHEEAGHLKSLINAIQPSVEETRTLPGDKIHNCVIANARPAARQIRESEQVLRKLIQREGVRVEAADYALSSGVVTLLDDAH